MWTSGNSKREHPPIHIDGTVVKRVASFKLLCIHITDKLNWSTHKDSIVKKAQQRLFNHRRLNKLGLSPKAPPGTATALPTTVRLHNASPGANYLPSRTPTPPDVTGRP